MNALRRTLDTRTWLLVALCTLLAAVLAMQYALLYLAPGTDSAVPVAAGDNRRTQDIANLVAPQLPALAAYDVITDRPLFRKTRRPPQIASAPSSPGVNRAAQIQRQWKLTGVALAGERRHALFEGHKDRTTIKLEEGMALAGWTLSNIAPDRVTLESDQETVTFMLRKPDDGAGRR